MSLSGIGDLAVHPTFVRKVTAAAVKSAVAIGNEEYDGTQYRIMRRALATSVLKDAEVWGEVFSWAVATNSQMTVETADSDIEWVISTVWDSIAGAYQTTA